MGTNYYHRTAICECCGRYDEQHICKSRTTFEGVVRYQDTPPYWVVVVDSWQAWKSHIQAEGEVWDEYGEQWKVEDFIDAVEVTKPENRRRQWEWMVRHRPEDVVDAPLAADGKTWLDADGFSFYGGAFS